MRVLDLPVAPQLCDRGRLALGDEDRVVAEATRPARLLGDATLERPCATKFLERRRETDELADVARATRFRAEPAQLAEELLDVVLARARPARRAQPGRAAERLDLEP